MVGILAVLLGYMVGRGEVLPEDGVVWWVVVVDLLVCLVLLVGGE